MNRHDPPNDDGRDTIMLIVAIGWIGIVLSFTGILYIAVVRLFFMGHPQ